MRRAKLEKTDFFNRQYPNIQKIYMILLNKFIGRYKNIITYAASKNINIWNPSARGYNTKYQYHINFIGLYDKDSYHSESCREGFRMWNTEKRLGLGCFYNNSRLTISNIKVAKILAEYNLYLKYKDIIYLSSSKCYKICEIV